MNKFGETVENALNLVMNDIYNRKTIYLLNTINVDYAKPLYFDLNLKASQHKYCPQFRYYFISKTHLHYKLIYKL